MVRIYHFTAHLTNGNVTRAVARAHIIYPRTPPNFQHNPPRVYTVLPSQSAHALIFNYHAQLSHTMTSPHIKIEPLDDIDVPEGLLPLRQQDAPDRSDSNK